MNGVILSDTDCEYVKSFFDETNSIDGKTPKYFSYGETRVLIKKNVSGLCCDVTDSTLINFLLDKLKILDIKSIHSSSVSIIKYSKGDYFDKHRDISRNGFGAAYKTLVIQLSDSTEYTGGDFCIEDEPQIRNKGSFILFLSSKEHEVKKIESGTRYSLTIFLHYDDFINKNTLI